MLRDEIFVRSESVVARVVAGETLIVPVRAKVGDLASIYSFNGTGTLIWKLLESPRTVAEMAAAVAQEYDVELGAGRAGCDEFCERDEGGWSGRGSGAGGNGGGLKDQWGGKDWQQRARESRPLLSDWFPELGGGFGAVKLRRVQRGSAPAPGW